MPKYPAAYHDIVKALLSASADPLNQENAIRITLGEMLDIWPESIRRDREA